MKNKPFVLTTSTLALTLVSVGVTTGIITNYNASAIDTNVDISVNVSDVIALAVEPPEPIEITSTDIAEHRLVSNPFTAKVSTNSVSGYKLYLSDTDNDTDLVNTTTTTLDPEKTRIETLASTTTAADFPVNRWGYSIDNGANYNKVSVAGEKQEISSETTAGSYDVDIIIGTKVNAGKTSGTYTGAITLTAIVPPKPGTATFDQAFIAAGKTKVEGTDNYAMQDMTSDITSYVREHESIQLVDTREKLSDNPIAYRTYWVTKLKDGHVWMTQNLDYDIQATGNIVSNNDGTTSTWDLPEGIKPTSKIMFEPSRGFSSSWDPKDCYTKDDGTGLSMTWDYDFEATCTTSDPSTDSHRHIGNYYQWHAATAGSGASTDPNEDAISSICPKGWRLPTSSIASGVSKSYSFGDMITAESISTSSDTDIRANPLYFVRSGSLDPRKGVDSPALGGSCWSSTAATVNQERRLVFHGWGVVENSSYNNYGFSVRCVAI